MCEILKGQMSIFDIEKDEERNLDFTKEQQKTIEKLKKKNWVEYSLYDNGMAIVIVKEPVNINVVPLENMERKYTIKDNYKSYFIKENGEIDETKITNEVLDHFEKYFYELDEEEDRIKSLANDYCRLRALGFDGAIEGYGFVLEDGKLPSGAILRGLEIEDINSGINFKTIDDGESCPYIDVKEIK